MPTFPERRPLRRYTLPLAVVLGAGIGLLAPTNPQLENALNRLRPSPLDERIVLVAIDDSSLNDYGLLHRWPRQLYARAFDTLEQAGAKVIGLDVVLTTNGESDADVGDSFSLPNLVLATAPGDVRNNLHPTWVAKTGVSALNNSLGMVREFQTAYQLYKPVNEALPPLVPSFARQVVAAAGVTVPLDTAPRLIRYTPPERMAEQTISFRDLVSGNVRYADLQDRIVLIGQNASGVAGLYLPDIDGHNVSGLGLQARAVSSLLSPRLFGLPTWSVALLCALAAGLTVLLGGLWAYVIAGLTLMAALVLWPLNIVFPGISVSLAAILAAPLVAFERSWQLKTLRTRDQLTGLGNRLAFTRAVEDRWASRYERPFALALVDLSGLRRVNEAYGRPAGDSLLREVSTRLQKTKRRNDLIFRWGADEFAILLDQTTPTEAQKLAVTLEQVLTPLLFEEVRVQANVGIATTADELKTPGELIETASRQRYRVKYQRVQEG